MTGVAVKYFLGKSDAGFPGMNGVEYLVYSTLSGAGVALVVVMIRRWYRLESRQHLRLGSRRVPAELLYIVPSGICTGVVVPTTTLMYTLPISVLVAMVIMRGAIIVVSRLVDSIQIRQGLLHKKVYAEENWGVFFAMLAVGAKLFWTPSLVNPVAAWLQGLGIDAAGMRLDPGGRDNFEFLRSKPAMAILGSYILAYAIRIYIMNYYKNTRAKDQKLDNKAFFAIEQIAAFVTMVIAAAVLLSVPPGEISQIQMFQDAVAKPHSQWGAAFFSGLPFGILSFFSVFIFMFKGRTATFAGLVNRLTSLVAGTTATLVFHWVWGGPFPAADDWLALFFIFVAIGFLTQAERRRRGELVPAAGVGPALTPATAPR
jgi:uncharacterized membrane protein YidH (DUF202 family)